MPQKVSLGLYMDLYRRCLTNSVYPMSISFTFGIITSEGSQQFLKEIVDSIRSQAIPAYEIIIVGWTASTVSIEGCKRIPFDDSVKAGWITRKKNLIFREAAYENIVIMHDYVSLQPGWYEGFLRHGDSFQLCINPIQTVDGRRFRDYLLFNQFLHPRFSNKTLLPYDCKVSPKVSRIMYVSGTYYVVKKELALKYPLREELAHNQGEDVIFCHDIERPEIQCNRHSSVRLLKHKPSWENEMSQEDYQALEIWAHMYGDEVYEKQRAFQRNWLARDFGIILP
jgi:hypothetical protein